MNTYTLSAEKVIPQHKTDLGLIISIILLWGLGLVTLYSTSTNIGLKSFSDSLYFVKRQLLFSALGGIVLLTCAYVNMDFLRKILPLTVIGTLIICALTVIPNVGIVKNGARRWIGFGTFVFQPAELVKIIIPLYFAHLYEKKYDHMHKFGKMVLPSYLILGLFIALLYFQGDFSTAMFILILGLSILFISGIHLRWIVSFFAIFTPVALLFIFTKEYRIRRILTYIKPDVDPFGSGFQLASAQKAVSSGGFWGLGLGGSIRNMIYVPEIQSDFIFAAWAQDMGFIGVLLYFILLCYFFIRGLKISFECGDRFKSLLSFGAVTAIFGQSLLNCGVVVGILPATGIPLPFFSSGGSSLLVTVALCGLLINVSRTTQHTGGVHE